jgi:translation initiation factor RLI1
MYEEAIEVFKEKVINDLVPNVMSERIRAFFKTLFIDYQNFSGKDVSPLLEEVDKFCETIKNHQNYLVDIYNKENVYSRKIEEYEGFFDLLFTQHE